MIDGCEKMAKDNSNNIDDLTERAKVLAEATGRDESDVLADLLDDGILNNSHLNPEKDLVTQLKEAAALITTVQEINTDISNNKVLNGGDNATSVKVETTLEGDIVDRAIASAQKKAENLKTLIATIIPIFLLITGGSMEAFGVINIFSDDETTPAQECNYGIDWVDWTWVSDELNVFGELWTDCDTNDSDSLDNMVVMANAFDTGVPSQEWVLGNIDSFNWYQDSNFHIELGNAPDRELDIWVDLFIQDEFDNGGIPIAQMQITGVEKPVEIVWGCMDSEATNFNPDANEDDGSCEYPVEEPCEVEIANHYRGHVADDEEQDAILVAFKVRPTNCDDEDLKIDMHLYQNGYAANYTHSVIIGGEGESQIEYIFDGVAVGNSWIPKITASLDGEILEQVNFWGIDVEQEEDETIYGCMDSEAENYDEEASEDDGSCEYDEPETCEEGFNHLETTLYVYDVNSIEVGIEVENTVAGCETDIEVSISLYREGLFYESLTYDHLPLYTIDYSVQELYIADDLFSELDDGDWDALVKIRDANTLEEYYTQIHTNVVSILA
tara:strand:+ start:6160 stop:7827 length:1668 start_codon:yes stop_codon:yes gene_type:complete